MEKNRIEFTDGYLSGFIMQNSRFKVLKTLISGGVAVGDPLSKVSSLNPKVATWMNDSGLYYVTIIDFKVFFRVKNGIIAKIWYSEPS